MSLRLAVFDMVGTTVVAGDEVPAAFREALASAGVAVSDTELARVRGRSKREAIATLLSGASAGEGGAEAVEAVYARFLDRLQAAYRAGARAAPGAREAFAALATRGVPVVLATGLDRGTAELLVHALGWDGIGLQGVVTGDEVARGRPAPDLIRAAMERAGVEDPAGVLVVGDTTADLDAAAAADVGWSVGVLGGAHPRERMERHPHTALLASVAELPAWLETMGTPPSGGGASDM